MGADWSLVVAVRRHGGVAKLLALVESLEAEVAKYKAMHADAVALAA